MNNKDNEKIPEHLLKKENGRYKGKVYYDRNKKKFIQIRISFPNSHLQRESVICGGWCDYYNDSQTNIELQYVKTEYVSQNFIAVDFSRDDLFYHNGIGWTVKDKEI